MKTRHLVLLISSLMVVCAFRGVEGSAAELERPVIASVGVDGDEVVVRVQVPAGIRRVTLECRERLSRRAWEPRAVVRTEGDGGEVVFRLARARGLEVMRVRGEAEEPLPASFYTGTNEFLGEVSDSSVSYPTSGGYGSLDGRETTSAPESNSREVVESDIWQVRDQTLYVFNQYRGLQIIDLADPDAARVRGTLELPAAGEQMYLLGSEHVVLLARDGCNYSQSEVVVVADGEGGAEVTARFPLEGWIQESRMVGTALYVATQRSRPMAESDGSTWEWGTQVAAFDLSDAGAPVARNTLWYPGYGNVVAATDVYFFVATYASNWQQSTLGIIDITAADGTLRAHDVLTVGGRVLDKFKMHHAGGVLTVISETRVSSGAGGLVTRLETYRLPHPAGLGPAGVTRLGSVELGHGERLRATRFDGDRVYVVTFFQIDPLWVVSLADPARPAILGSVEIPGWSTYIEPLGDRLVTVGVEESRVAVSLFDVSDPAAPALASRVFLGETHSWSEANHDEKAFTVLPGANLILVPFNGYVAGSYASAVQLIDLHRDELVARGQITGTFGYRRATAYGERILSLSGWELQTVDATDRDAPVVTHRLPLAWSIDQVFLAGDHLIEVQWGSSWDNRGGPMLRVAAPESPDEVLGELALANLPILGASLKGNRLYVAQGRSDYYFVAPLDATGGVGPEAEPNFVLSVINLESLPLLSIEGEVRHLSMRLGWGTQWQAVWPQPGVLVWAGGGHGYWYRGYYPIDIFAAPAAMAVESADARIAPWPIWGGAGGCLLAFDVSDPAAPKLASELDLAKEDRWGRGFSPAYVANGLVYLSHQTHEYLPVERLDVAGGSISVDGTDGTAEVYCWVQRVFLDVVDYTDAADPLVRRPVSLPGMLTGISPEGHLLYTTGRHWEVAKPGDWAEYLDALAYDGVAAHLVDSLALPSQWPHPVRVVGPNLFVGRPGVVGPDGSAPEAQLENWVLGGSGRFERLGAVGLPAPASVLADFDGMLAVQDTGNRVLLFAIGDAAGLGLIGRGEPTGCWWYDLGRAAGDLVRGLWVPMGAYGVDYVPVSP